MAGLARAASRFQEGSMNDRVSAVPPVEFIGHHQTPSPRHNHNSTSSNSDEEDLDDIDIAAEFLSYVTPRRRQQPATIHHTRNIPRGFPHSHTVPTVSSSIHHGTMSKKDKRSSFLPSIWTGLREKLNFRKTDHPKRPRSVHSNLVPPPHNTTTGTSISPSTQFSSGLPPMPLSPLLGMGMADSSVRPTREEVMANYKTLMAQGFFGTHAIQSTRQPPPKPLVTSQSMATMKHSYHSHNSPLPTNSLQSNPASPTSASLNTGPNPATTTGPLASPFQPPVLRPMSSPMEAPRSFSTEPRGMKRSGRDSPDADLQCTHKKLRKSASRISDITRLRRHGSTLTSPLSLSFFSSSRPATAAPSTSTSLGHFYSKSMSSVPSAAASRSGSRLYSDRMVFPRSPVTPRVRRGDISTPVTPVIHLATGDGRVRGVSEVPRGNVLVWETQRGTGYEVGVAM